MEMGISSKDELVQNLIGVQNYIMAMNLMEFKQIYMP